MNRLSIALCAFLATPVAVITSCATDNGQNVFGPQFGPNDRVDAQAESGPVEGGRGDDSGGDAATDAGADSPVVPSCTGTGTVAVLAGTDTTLTGAVSVDGAAWTGAAIAGGAAKSLPALVAFGTGFVGVTRGTGDTLQSVSAGGASFGAPSTIVASGVKDSPALAVVGTTAHTVWVGGSAANQLFFHGTNGGGSWDSATDPVGTPPGDPQSFGTSAPALASASADLLFAQAGSDNGLYVRSWNASWTVPAGVPGAGAFTSASPAFAPASGSFDVVLVFAEKTSKKLQWTARSAADKTQWSGPAVLNDAATTTQPIALAAVSSTSLVAAFEGEDGKGYASLGTISGAAITWTAATPLVAGGVSVDSPPRVAKGVCGDDAIAVFAAAGQARVVSLRGGTWGAPRDVTGASGARVAIATR